jgi:formiminotetrahydrofolate cyclodeaminase
MKEALYNYVDAMRHPETDDAAKLRQRLIEEASVSDLNVPADIVVAYANVLAFDTEKNVSDKMKAALINLYLALHEEIQNGEI